MKIVPAGSKVDCSTYEDTTGRVRHTLGDLFVIIPVLVIQPAFLLVHELREVRVAWVQCTRLVQLLQLNICLHQLLTYQLFYRLC